VLNSPPRLTVNHDVPDGIDFWATRYENHTHGHETDESSANDLYSLTGTGSYHDLDGHLDDMTNCTSESNFAAFDRFDRELYNAQTASVGKLNTMLETRDLSALRGSAFASSVFERAGKSRGQIMSVKPGKSKERAQYPEFKTSFFFDDKMNHALKTANVDETGCVDDKVFWDNVKHWNRENCGWTMGRDKRFRKKVDRDIERENPASRFAYLEEDRKKESNPAPTPVYHVSNYQDSGKKHESMPWLKDRNLGPGDYEYPDQWEVKDVCGTRPQSSVFQSASKRDLFDNDGFSRTRLGALVGPTTPKKVLTEIERTPSGLVMEKKKEEDAERNRRPSKEQGDFVSERERYLKRADLARTKANKTRGSSRGASRLGSRGGMLPSASAPTLRPSTSAPTIGLHTTRWDRGGVAFPQTQRAPLGEDKSGTKKLYRVVRDIRTGHVITAEIGKHNITTPNVQDIASMMQTGGLSDMEVCVGVPPKLQPRTLGRKKVQISANVKMKN
jgi:hypothetical protein